MAGLEPATPRLEVWCAIHCATRAQEKNLIALYWFRTSDLAVNSRTL